MNRHHLLSLKECIKIHAPYESITSHPQFDINEALENAIEYAYISLVKQLVGEGGTIPKNALLTASRNGCLELVEYLVKLGLDVNFSSFTSSPIVESFPYLDVLKTLVENGAIITEYAIKYATWCGPISVMEYFISKGIDPERFIKYACTYEREHKLTYLLDVCGVNVKGKRGLYYSKNEKIRKCLIEHGAILPIPTD